jgi:hypothetical protein
MNNASFGTKLGAGGASQDTGGRSCTAQAISNFLSKRGPSFECSSPVGSFHIVLRLQGKKLCSIWIDDARLFQILEQLLSQYPGASTLEICAQISKNPIGVAAWPNATAQRKRGRIGLQLDLNGQRYRVSPLESISTNRSLERWFKNTLKEHDLSPEYFFAIGGSLSILEMRQFIASLNTELTVLETFRGNQIVSPKTVNLDLLDDVINKMASWFMANTNEAGRLPYKFWPSRGEESEADNPIRRFMATIALNRLAEARKDAAMARAAERNLAYNVSRFYSEESGLGKISWEGTVKLGAVALAGLAILESETKVAFSSQLAALRRMVDHLWQPDGGFRTFYEPRERNDNQNFYPGEALLFWTLSLAREPNTELMNRALHSVEFYRQHFIRNPNPAFVPWHTQAATVLYQLTGRVDLRDYVFSLSDWLIPLQQWGGTLDPDLWGRFYSPIHPEYGPPHASSTGVYMEGLADGLRLAIETGDNKRIRGYKRALLRGLRSIAQLQFTDSIEAFYVREPARVMGGVRTEAYNNEIRIDNIQHALMGLLKFRPLLAGQNPSPPGDSITST